MFKQNYKVIGVMSGTSLDGVDLAYIKFNKSDSWNFEIDVSETISYSDEWVKILRTAIYLDVKELAALNVDYTELLAQIINNFISKNNLTDIDAICSHGHTILHQPQNGITLQIGNLPLIRELLDHPIVCNFRVQDVKLGGQGAPLVPIGDELLFSNYDYCLNLGGFSNISFNENGNRIAFDISPVNTVLNFYANQLGFHYDDEGEIARSGNCNQELLNQLNAIDFYAKAYPKSLGIEFVNALVFPVIESFEISLENKLNTFIEHIAIQISKVCTKENAILFITGGGVYNKYLIERIQFYLKKIKVILPDDKTIQYKEALIFGFLGVLRLRNEINVLASVTGANENHSSGEVFY